MRHGCVEGGVPCHSLFQPYFAYAVIVRHIEVALFVYGNAGRNIKPCSICWAVGKASFFLLPVYLPASGKSADEHFRGAGHFVTLWGGSAASRRSAGKAGKEAQREESGAGLFLKGGKYFHGGVCSGFLRVP